MCSTRAKREKFFRRDRWFCMWSKAKQSKAMMHTLAPGGRIRVSINFSVCAAVITTNEWKFHAVSPFQFSIHNKEGT